ncbi:MAG: tetratricopeptide repeat protein, partial [Arenimonas sp.]
MSEFVLFALLLSLLAVVFTTSRLWRGSRRLALALSVGLPLAAAGLYYLKGEPAALDPQVTVAPRSVDEAIAQLEKRLISEPDNFEGMVLLARSYMALEKFDLARDTYAKAVKLHPGDNDLQVEYAESLLRTSPDHRFPPAAVAMLQRALEQDPQNQRALFFMGIQQMQDSQPANAAATWGKLLPLLGPQTAGALRQQIAAARTAAGLPPLPEEAVASGSSALSIDIQIDPSLAQAVRPG